MKLIKVDLVLFLGHFIDIVLHIMSRKLKAFFKGVFNGYGPHLRFSWFHTFH